MTVLMCYLELNNKEVADYFYCHTTEEVDEDEYTLYITDMFESQIDSYIEEEKRLDVENKYSFVLDVNLVCLPVDEEDVDNYGFNIPMNHYFHLPDELTAY